MTATTKKDIEDLVQSNINELNRILTGLSSIQHIDEATHRELYLYLEELHDCIPNALQDAALELQENLSLEALKESE